MHLLGGRNATYYTALIGKRSLQREMTGLLKATLLGLRGTRRRRPKNPALRGPWLRIAGTTPPRKEKEVDIGEDSP